MQSPPANPSAARRPHPERAAFSLVAMFLLLGTYVAAAAWHGSLEFEAMREVAPMAVPATLIFATAARLLHGVTTSGALAGWAVALLLWLAMGWRGFALLFAVFGITFLATRFGYARKQQLGTAERRGGRTAAQVAANVGMAAFLVVIMPPYWWVGTLAVLAEAAADTVSSEIGQAIGGRPYLITSFRRVEPGADGAISLAGTLAGILAAIIIAATATVLEVTAPRATAIAAAIAAAAIAATAGIAGMFADSILGATLERRGLLDNDQVNLASTALAALFGCLSASLFKL